MDMEWRKPALGKGQRSGVLSGPVQETRTGAYSINTLRAFAFAQLLEPPMWSPGRSDWRTCGSPMKKAT
jgi:hypothetical protein